MSSRVSPVSAGAEVAVRPVLHKGGSGSEKIKRSDGRLKLPEEELNSSGMRRSPKRKESNPQPSRLEATVLITVHARRASPENKGKIIYADGVSLNEKESVSLPTGGVGRG